MRPILRVIAICIGVLICVPAAIAQVPFFQVYGNNYQSAGKVVRPLSNGDLFVGGFCNAGGNGEADLMAMRLDSSGTVIWNYYYGTGGDEYFAGGDVTPNEELLLMTNSNVQDAVGVIKVDGNGDTVWTKLYSEGVGAQVVGFSIYATSDGGFAILGANDSVNGEANAKIIRCDSNGNVMWSRIYPTWGDPVQFTQCSNGDCVFASKDGMMQTTMCRITANGDSIWKKVYVGAYYEQVSDIDAIGNDVIVTGTYGDIFQFQTLCFVRRISSSGNVVWEKILDDGSDSFEPRASCIEGNVVTIVGDRNPSTSSEGFILQIDVNGVLQSQRTCNFNAEAYMYDVNCTVSGQLYISGSIFGAFTANDSGSVMVFSVNPLTQTLCGLTSMTVTTSTATPSVSSLNESFTSSGVAGSWACIRTTGVSIMDGCSVGIDEKGSTKFSVYPNPSSNYFVVHSAWPATGVESFVLFNSFGQEVKRVVITKPEERISCEELAAGIYFYSVLTEGQVIGSGKIVKE